MKQSRSYWLKVCSGRFGSKIFPIQIARSGQTGQMREGGEDVHEIHDMVALSGFDPRSG